MTRYLLCTDLDRTLIPNGHQPLSPRAMAMFEYLVKREEVTLAYVTGRHRELVSQAIEVFSLPLPDFVIANVGATIYETNAQQWKQWDDWDEKISSDWADLSHDELCELLEIFPLAQLQENEKQARHKLSFYVPIEVNPEIFLKGLRTRLQQANIKANLIWSIDEQKNIGLLDILPNSANKLHAIHFLMQRHQFLEQTTLFAGDSGNDLDVLLSDIPAVLVANAEPAIKTRVSTASKSTLYIARGDYLGMNGNYSAGILEGAAHFWPDIRALLRDFDSSRK